MTKTWAVYDLIVDGALVYVGCTSNPVNRLYQHKARRKVPKHAELVVVQRFRRRPAALAAETRRIEELNPPLNKAMRLDIKAERRRKAYQAKFAEWEAVAEANRRKLAEIEADYLAWVSSGQQH